MTNSHGQHVGGVYGFTYQIQKMIQNKKPRYIIVAFDTGAQTWRHKTMSEYKAHRKPSPPELRHQFQWARDACIAMNIDYIEISDYEADDICAAYAKKYKDEYEITIASIDKDLLQLVQTNVNLYDPFKKIDLDEAWVINKLSIMPHQVVDYLAMTGDASDGIPGIPGIGPKTASKWLNLYHNIDTIMQNINILSPSRLANALRDQYQTFIDAKELVTLKADIDVPLLNVNKYHNLSNINHFFQEIGIEQQL